MCVQKYDMLCAAGLKQDDRRLAELFDVSRVCPAAFEQFLEVVKSSASREVAECASHELMHAVLMRAEWSQSAPTEAAWIKKLNTGIPFSFLSATDPLASVKFSRLNLHPGKPYLHAATLCFSHTSAALSLQDQHFTDCPVFCWKVCKSSAYR